MKRLTYLTLLCVFISCNNNKSSQMEEPDYDSIYVMVDDEDEDEFIGYKLKSNERIVSQDGFQWIKIIDEENDYVGAKDISGEIIIPLSREFTEISYCSVSPTEGYFFVNDDEYEGVYSSDGKVVISTNREYVDITFYPDEGHTGFFHTWHEYYDEKSGEYYELEGACDMTGKEFIPCKYTHIECKDGVVSYLNMASNPERVNCNKKLDANGHITETSTPSSYRTSMSCPCCNGTGNFMGQFCNGCGGSGTIYYTVNSGDVPVSTSVPVTAGTSNSGNTQSHNNRDNYLGQRCGVCEGDGDEIVNVWGGSGVSDYCEKCRKTFDYMHYHRQCKTCGGRGSY